jgi:uncharacterized protein (DUF433 family)
VKEIGMAASEAEVLDRVVVNREIMAGKPTVRGTRIPVERVLRHLEEHDRADLFAAFPELTEEDVRACLACARQTIARRHAVVSAT